MIEIHSKYQLKEGSVYRVACTREHTICFDGVPILELLNNQPFLGDTWWGPWRRVSPTIAVFRLGPNFTGWWEHFPPSKGYLWEEYDD